MTGCHVRTVSEWLISLHQAGLIREVLNEGSHSSRWAWQRVPFEFEDFAP